MDTRKRLRVHCFALVKVAAIVAVLVLCGVPSGDAQRITSLLQFTNDWKYDLTGSELGSAWCMNDFDDSAWESGPGLLGYDQNTANYLLHVPSGFGTIFPSPLSQVVTTYYFRTKFEFVGATNFAQLSAKILVDDGCAVWLNGRLAGSVRMPAAPFYATTVASGSTPEGQLQVLALTNYLQVGENCLAVEVHQAPANNSDVAFGIRLLVSEPIPLVITNQPRSVSVVVGDAVAINVGVSGAPITYRWLKNGVFISNADSSTISFKAAATHTGEYQVICSNALGAVTSMVATLDVYPDLNPPRALMAIGDNTLEFASTGANSIHVRFSEPMWNSTAVAPFSVRNLNNYRLIRTATTNQVTVTNALYSSSSGLLLQTDPNDPDWVPRADYILTINNVADIRTNFIAPDTTLPVLWRSVTNLLQTLHPWRYHNSYYFEPNIYDESWWSSDYQMGPSWKEGLAPFFYNTDLPDSGCGDLVFRQTAIDWQVEPALFRTTFLYPTNWPNDAVLVLAIGFDDNVAVFLNGVEIYRFGGFDRPIKASTRPSTGIGSPICGNFKVAVNNLNPGTNHLAVAVVQHDYLYDPRDIYFAMRVDVSVPASSALHLDPKPSLHTAIIETNTIRFSWIDGGYVLEASTNLDHGTLSYPHGPWTPVPRLSNPYDWPLTNNDARYFRLKR